MNVRKFAFLIFGLSTAIVSSAQPNAWINEFHYDNASTDANESVEIIIENPNLYNLNDIRVDLYNGNDSLIYNSTDLAGMTAGNVEGNFSIFHKIFPNDDVQNGHADAFCLSYQNMLISEQFLSYEGVIDGLEGPALGVASSDVGVFESNTTTLETESIQLSGLGNTYDSFVWQAPATATFGSLNNGQTLTTTAVFSKNNQHDFINPVTNSLTLVAESGSLVSIQNTAGEVVFNEKMRKDIQEVNTAKLPPGLYILSIIKKDGTKTSVKFIKN